MQGSLVLAFEKIQLKLLGDGLQLSLQAGTFYFSHA